MAKRFKPKFYLVFPRSLTDEIQWPEKWGNTCAANLCPMLCELLNVSTIGSELKWIINGQHRWQLVNDYNVTYDDLEHYVKADCSLLSFTSAGTRKRALTTLLQRGATNIVLVDSYRDVILQQAHYYLNKAFINP